MVVGSAGGGPRTLALEGGVVAGGAATSERGSANGLLACGVCKPVCRPGDERGSLSYVGTGKGDFIQETTYKYVGDGQGEFDPVTPTASKFFLYVGVGVGLVLLIVVLVFLGFPTVTTTTT